ncbi:MAG TPA: HDIG domain-containing protein [Candidatus Limnocylindria bacterium]|nr:HDIG domain-containing protein [Candidatus Limnocylindria bacterium]
MFTPRTLDRELLHPSPRLLRAIGVVALVSLALTAVLGLTIVPGQVRLALGDEAPQEIRAPRSASFLSASQTEEARDDAAEAEPQVYVDVAPPGDILDARLRAYNVTSLRIERIVERRAAGDLTQEEAALAVGRIAPILSMEQAARVAGMTPDAWASVSAAGRTVLEAAQSGDVEEDRIAEVRDTVRNRVTTALEQPDREIAGDLAASQVRANREVDAQATEHAREARRQQVEPVLVDIREGDVVVAEGQIVEELDLEELEALGLTSPTPDLDRLLGRALAATTLVVLLAAFLWRFEPRIWHRGRSLLLFVLALLVTAVALRIAADRALWIFVVPTSATVMLIGILLGSQAGAAMAVAVAVVAGLVTRDGLEPAVYVLAGGITSLLAIARAERLNVFIRAGGYLSVSNVVVLLAFALFESRDPTSLLPLLLGALANAMLSVFGAVGSFAVLGNLFGIMTVFQLLELANPSSRLLRRLLLDTPGTYHHSVMVGNLAERAAETIGADPLLARVAAYYHDIGKMRNPLAFVENQAGGRNIHDELSAETSARIIGAHIRDGIDLAYEHRLPVQITAFIPQHHGTSVMSFFYGKAISEAGGNAAVVNRDAFRYPGPTPQSREAAILMLADGVEASVRSLDSKDEASIRAMVERIVEARVEDGQLDDAELTLKNIADIKEAFVQQLLGMYHQRIKYPDNVVPLDRREAGGA